MTTLLLVNFSKAFDSIRRGKMEQIFLAYGLPKESIINKMFLYKNKKAMFSSPNSDTDFFGITTRVLQGDTLAPFLFIICQDYLLRTSINLMKGNGLIVKKAKVDNIPPKLLWM